MGRQRQPELEHLADGSRSWAADYRRGAELHGIRKQTLSAASGGVRHKLTTEREIYETTYFALITISKA